MIDVVSSILVMHIFVHNLVMHIVVHNLCGHSEMHIYLCPILVMHIVVLNLCASMVDLVASQQLTLLG